MLRSSHVTSDLVMFDKLSKQYNIFFKQVKAFEKAYDFFNPFFDCKDFFCSEHF